MAVRLLGVPQFMAAIDGMVTRADFAAREATGKGAHLIEAATKQKLAESSGTVTRGQRDSRGRFTRNQTSPSPPGQPPALQTGQLRRSVRVEGPTRTGPGAWESKTGPTAAYGRIQELGGVTGRGGATTLPARPYLGPALKELIDSGRLAEVYTQAWRSAWYRG
jgi:hypothetical protein